MLANIKLALAGGVVALLLLGVAIVMYQRHEVKSLTVSNAVASSTIAAQASSVSEAHATVVATVQTAAITDASALQAASDASQINHVVHGITQTQAEKEAAVKKAYQALIASEAKNHTPAPTTSLADELSDVRVRSMWQTYCQLNPTLDTAACAANQ